MTDRGLPPESQYGTVPEPVPLPPLDPVAMLMPEPEPRVHPVHQQGSQTGVWPDYGAGLAPAPYPASWQQPQPVKKSAKPIVALAFSIIGMVVALIPQVTLVCWPLLAVGFLLGLSFAVRQHHVKGVAIAAIIVAILGAVAGALTYFNTFDFTPPSQVAAGQTRMVDDGGTGESGTGTREDPYPFGAVIANNNWSIQFTQFQANADADVAAARPDYPPAPHGQRWISFFVAATYTGPDRGDVWNVSFDYVTAAGTVINDAETSSVGLEPEYDVWAGLYDGGTEDGRYAMLVPDTLDGIFEVRLGYGAETVLMGLPPGQ